MARRRGRGWPGGQQPGGGRPGRLKKEGPIQDAVRRAINEEIKGVPPAEILMHLRSAGLDTQTARMVYGHVKEQVAKVRRRTMWGFLIAGAIILVAALGLVTAMTVSWQTTWYVWWILVSLLAVAGLALLVVGQRGLRKTATAGKGADDEEPRAGRQR